MTASRKPRTIRNVESYVRPDGAKRCKVTVVNDGNEEIIPLHDLTRPELQRAAAMVFPLIPGNVWLRFKSDVIQTLIRNNDFVAAKAAVDALPNVRPNAKTIEVPVPPLYTAKPVEVTPVEVDTPVEHSKAEQLANLLVDLAGKQGVDENTVRKVVQEEVRKVADEIRITRVEVKLPDKTANLPELHHKDLPKLIAKVSAGVNLFIVGPAGTGKSVAASQVAEALGLRFFAISFGPTTPTSKLFGYNDANGKFQATPLFEAYNAEGDGGIFLGDELDNGHPGLLAEQNQFLANGHCAFANGMAAKHDDFRYIATGNTYGRGGDRLFVGRNQLDAATLDRFVFHELQIDEKLEEQAALRFSTNDSVGACREWIELVRRVRAQVATFKLPVVISPRASIDGCKLVTTGAFTRDELVDDVLLKGVGGDVRSKLSIA